jgi:uroporphyrinogen-III decarboxylase
MTSRERVIRTLRHQEVDRPPRHLWIIPYIDMYKQEEKTKFLERFEMDIADPNGIRYGKSPYGKGEACRKGKYTDAWGTEWEVLEDGVIGEVKNPLIQTEEDLDGYKLPWEMLDGMNCEGQADHYRATGKFILAGSQVRPFERMQFLMGSEEFFVHMALETPLFTRLLAMLHEFSVRELKRVAAQTVDAVSFMDDWGSQTSLLISPDAWRKHFKPLYKEYCDIIKSGDKFVFFHSDGFIEPIYPDLLEIGVDAVNSQMFCMDMEELGRKYAGKITFWGELDRQYMLPYGTQAEVRESVRRLGRAVGFGRTRSGLIAQLSWEYVTPLENVIAAYDEFNRL